MRLKLVLPGLYDWGGRGRRSPLAPVSAAPRKHLSAVDSTGGRSLTKKRPVRICPAGAGRPHEHSHGVEGRKYFNATPVTAVTLRATWRASSLRTRGKGIPPPPSSIWKKEGTPLFVITGVTARLTCSLSSAELLQFPPTQFNIQIEPFSSKANATHTAYGTNSNAATWSRRHAVAKKARIAANISRMTTSAKPI